MARAGPSKAAWICVELNSSRRPRCRSTSARACVSNACRRRAAGRARGQGRRHDRRQHAVGVDRIVAVAEEVLDGVEHRVLVADERQVIVAGQLDQRRARDPAGDVAAFVDRQQPIVGAVQDQRRHADRRQHVADVDVGVHPRQRQRRAGAGAHPQVGAPPVAERRVVRRRSARAPRGRPVRPTCVGSRRGSCSPCSSVGAHG